jgi:Ribbon-helix-helix protein, copG family
MSMLQRRLQVLIDEARHERLQALAKERGVSVGSLVRDAIDRGLASPDARKAAAGARILAAAPMPAPAVDDLLSELDDLRGRRG